MNHTWSGQVRGWHNRQNTNLFRKSKYISTQTLQSQAETNKDYFEKKETKWFLNIAVFRIVRSRVQTELRECLLPFGLESCAFLPILWGGRNSTQWATASFMSFLDHTQRRNIFGRTPLDEWSARRRDLYLTKHNRQTSMPPVGFEPTILAGERPQTHAFDRAATGFGSILHSNPKCSMPVWNPSRTDM